MKALRTMIAAAVTVLAAAGAMAATFEYKYTPLVREGAKWEYRCGLGYVSQTPFTISIEGDTTLGGKAYKKCYIDLYENHMDGFTENDIKYFNYYHIGTHTLAALLREEDKKVYAVYMDGYLALFDNCCFGQRTYTKDDYSNTKREWLLYDFNDVASVLAMPFSRVYVEPDRFVGYTITSTIQTKIGKYLRNSYKVSVGTFDGAGNLLGSRNLGMRIIEGIGLVQGEASSSDIYYNPEMNGSTVFAPAASFISLSGLDFNGLYLPQFRRMKEDGKTVYKGTYDYGGFPDIDTDDATGISEVGTDGQAAGGDYYNLMGQKVDSTSMTPGIYIHGGKKVIVNR